jgi:hypothetical protein
VPVLQHRCCNGGDIMSRAWTWSNVDWLSQSRTLV